MINPYFESENELVDTETINLEHISRFDNSEPFLSPYSHTLELIESPKTYYSFETVCGLRSKLKIFYNKYLNSNHPCAKQPRPLNQSRYLLAIGYIIFIALSGNVYFGWPGLSSLLFESGAYSWLCLSTTTIAEKRYLCEAQDTAVQRLYQIAMPTHFTMSMIAGILIDNIGPKYTAILGQGMNFIAWLLLSFASESFNVYIFAFVLIGLGADTSTLPTLHLSNLFPGYHGIVIAILGAAISASFSVPAVMQVISNTFHLPFNIIALFYASILFLLIIYAAICIPKNVFQPLEYFERSEHYKPITSEPTLTRSTRQIVTTLFHKFYENLYTSRHQIISKPFIGISFYFCTTSLIVNFYVVSGEQILTENVNTFFGIITPFGFISTIIYGHLVDLMGPIWVMFINTSFALLGYIFGNLDNLFFKYVSAILLTVYISIYTSQVYFLVKDKFEESHFGKLVGTASMFGGIVSIFSVYLYDPLTKITFSGNYLYVSLIMIVLLLLNYLSLFFMRGHSKLNSQRNLRLLSNS